MFTLVFLAFMALADGPVIVPIVDGQNQCFLSARETSSDAFDLLSQSTGDITCSLKYQQNKCAELKSKLPKEEQKKILSCDRSEPKNSVYLAVSCGHGIETFVVDTVKGIIDLPQNIIKTVEQTGQWFRTCNENPELKRALLTPVAMSYTPREIEMMIKTVPCEGLQLTVQTEIKSIQQRIDDKIQLQRQFHEQFPDKMQPPYLALSPTENDFRKVQAELMKNPGLIRKAWDEVRQRLPCYTPQAQTEVVCAIAAEVAGTMISGAAFTTIGSSQTLSRTARSIANALKSPSHPDDDILRLAHIDGPGSPTVPPQKPSPSALASLAEKDPAGFLEMDGTRVKSRSFDFKAEVSAPSSREISRQKVRIKAATSPEAALPAARKSGLAPSQLAYSPVPSLPGRKISPTENVLRDSPVQSMEELNWINESSYVVKLGNGQRGIWKPHREVASSNYRAEVLAYELDQALGFDLVPPTVVRTIDGRIGSIQQMRSSSTSAVARSQDLKKQNLFDYIIENGDRNPTNFLVSPQGQVISIDHAMSFTGQGRPSSFRSMQPQIDSFLNSAESRPILQNIQNFLKNPQSRPKVEEYLGREDTARLFERLEKIIQYDELR